MQNTTCDGTKLNVPVQIVEKQTQRLCGSQQRRLLAASSRMRVISTNQSMLTSAASGNDLRERVS